MPAVLATSVAMNASISSRAPLPSSSSSSATPSAHAAPLTAAELTAVLADPGVTLIDFTAAWCGPCKQLAPILAELGRDYAGRARIVAVDVDLQPQVAQGFRVTSMPTMVFVRAGREVGRIVGLRNRKVVGGALERALAGGVAITG